MDISGSLGGGAGVVCAVAALLGAVSVATVSLINHEQPQPYMVGSIWRHNPTIHIHVYLTTKYVCTYAYKNGRGIVNSYIRCSMLVTSFSLFSSQDEIFHVPQAQNYCAGHYSHWDPMITTLPGLYVFSLAVLWW